MDLDNLLNTAQQVQLAQALAQVLSWGFGLLEIRVEKGCLRWLRPGRAIYSPKAARPAPADDRTLPEILGPWYEAFTCELALLLGEQFGSLIVGIEHGSIRFIRAEPNQRFRTGKTGDIQGSGTTTTLQP